MLQKAKIHQDFEVEKGNLVQVAALGEVLVATTESIRFERNPLRISSTAPD
jgi:hypothetical protein